MSISALQASFTELGPAAPNVAAVIAAPTEPITEWAVECEDGAIIEFRLSEDEQTLHLAGDLPTPEESRIAEASRNLLVYNALTADTGGVFACLASPDGPFQLRASLPAGEVTLGTLEAVVANFAGKLAVWRTWLELPADAPTTDAPDLPLGALKI